MANWFNLVEAHLPKNEARGLTADERDYRIFKQIMKGQPVPPSKQRQAFLDAFRKWRFKLVIPDPDLSRGKALLAAKEHFFDVERGVPKFFEPQRTLRITNWDAQKTAEGWVITIDFQGQFKKKAGRRVEPSMKELQDHGFELMDKAEPAIGKWRIRLELPIEKARTEQEALQMVAQDMKDSFSFIESPKIVDYSVSKVGDKWDIQITAEGEALTAIPADVEEI